MSMRSVNKTDRVPVITFSSTTVLKMHLVISLPSQESVREKVFTQNLKLLGKGNDFNWKYTHG